MARFALAPSLRVVLCLASFLAGCSSTSWYGTHLLKCEWSLVGVCGPHGRTWLEDGAGKELLSVTERTVSPDRRWMALFDVSNPSTLYLLDVQRDALRTIPIREYLWSRSARWSPDGSRLAVLAGEDPTRLCVVTLGEEPGVEWTEDDPRAATELEAVWRDGTARIAAR